MSTQHGSRGRREHHIWVLTCEAVFIVSSKTWLIEYPELGESGSLPSYICFANGGTSFIESPLYILAFSGLIFHLLKG